MAKEYWCCMIGPAEGKKLSHRADFPLRTAVQKAFEDMIGVPGEVCYSDWGCEADAKLIMGRWLDLSKAKDLQEEAPKL